MERIGGTIITRKYSSPCGELLLGSFDGRLCLCNWTDEKHPGRIHGRLKKLLNAEYMEGTSDIIEKAAAELDEYFRGERMDFDIPLLLAGSDFQKRVWQPLPSIPYGQTVSYGELAAAIGAPKSVRAVANANGANAISIILPCHRVIGSDGRLTGYGGGLRAKQYLLDLECTECTRIGQTQQLSISQTNNPQN